MEGDAFDRQEIVAEIAPAPAGEAGQPPTSRVRAWGPSTVWSAATTTSCAAPARRRSAACWRRRCQRPRPSCAPSRESGGLLRLRAGRGGARGRARALRRGSGGGRAGGGAGCTENPAAGHAARGLPGHETWTLVATPQTDEVRPNAKTWWDKGKTSQEPC
ncbi:unnamed protein product [Prorocentrum cordatum]|uniref:Uncharacterized protein n=1 Tax=Prorocentrum cordatum TaxID=2364126 RepID=A0ABN9XQL5_9DINO|nr:unnamed protein product [Polarella glacialis]